MLRAQLMRSLIDETQKWGALKPTYAMFVVDLPHSLPHTFPSMDACPPPVVSDYLPPNIPPQLKNSSVPIRRPKTICRRMRLWRQPNRA